MDEYMPQWAIIISYPLAIFTIVIAIWHKNLKDMFPDWMLKDFIYFSFIYFIILTTLTVQKSYQKRKPGRIFTGQWEKRFKGPDKNDIKSTWSQPEVFEVKNGYQYIAYQENCFEHRFDILNLKVNNKNKMMTFTKIYKPERYKFNHSRVNTLTIKDIKKMDYFTGVETGDETGELTEVIYVKIKPKTRVSNDLLIARCPNPNCTHIVPIHKKDIRETIHCVMCGMDFKYSDNKNQSGPIS